MIRAALGCTLSSNVLVVWVAVQLTRNFIVFLIQIVKNMDENG